MRVPVYGERQVSLRPDLQQGINVRASASAFGADIGQGMQQLGRGLGQAAEVMGQLQAFDDTQRAKDADTRFANWSRERMYGEGGFMTLEGRAAVDGRAAFEKEAEEKRREFGKDLTGGAAQAYGNASQARVQSIYQQSIVHTANARKQWFNDAAASRLDTFAEDALASYGSPEMVNKNIALGQAEIREQGRMLGWDADTLANREKEYISSTRMNVALRMLSDDPVKADAYYKEHKDQFTGPHQFKFEESLKVPLTQAHVLTHTDGFFSGGSAAAEGYYRSIRVAESGGNDSAKNPNSTATGRYQFIQSTWNQLARQFPSLGLTPDGRTDPAQQERAIKAFTEQNAQVLARGGVQITNGSLYAAHFLGARGALDVLRAARGASVAAIVGESVIKANGFLRNMTVGQFAAWAERKGGGSGSPAQADAQGQGPGADPGYSTIEPYLATISDPTEREMTRKAIYARLDSQQKAERAQREAYTAQAFNLIETQNISPFDLPPNIATGIGMEGMSSLMTYWEKRASNAEIKTDATQFMELQDMFANDPEAYSKLDLFQYKNSLSKEDWKRASDWRQSALTDMRKAREDGMNIGSAMTFARTQLEGVGLSTEGLKDSRRDEMAKRIAQFQMSLTDEMESFKRQNGKAPDQYDLQKMVNKLLLPVVIKTPGSIWDSNRDGFSFESGFRAEGTVVTVNPKLTDIPIDMRRGIASDLELELGRKPSEEEIISRYQSFVLGTPEVYVGGLGPQIYDDVSELPSEYSPGLVGYLNAPVLTSPGIETGGSGGPSADKGKDVNRKSPSISENEGVYFDGISVRDADQQFLR